MMWLVNIKYLCMVNDLGIQFLKRLNKTLKNK
jgi:hypothetical protein